MECVNFFNLNDESAKYIYCTSSDHIKGDALAGSIQGMYSPKVYAHFVCMHVGAVYLTGSNMCAAAICMPLHFKIVAYCCTVDPELFSRTGVMPSLTCTL